MKQSQEPGWLEGTLNGKTGLIPENYVEMLPWHGGPLSKLSNSLRHNFAKALHISRADAEVEPSFARGRHPKLSLHRQSIDSVHQGAALRSRSACCERKNSTWKCTKKRTLYMYIYCEMNLRLIPISTKRLFFFCAGRGWW